MTRDSSLRTLLGLFCWVWFGVGVAGCATSRGAAAKPTPGKPAVESAEVVPEEVRDFIFHERAPFVVRAKVAGWEPVWNFVHRYLKARWSGTHVEVPPARELPDTPEQWVQLILDDRDRPGEPLEHLDRDATAYVSVWSEAPENLYRTYPYGLGWLPRAEMSRALAVRVALPADDPEGLAEELRERIDSPAPGGFVAVGGEKWVRAAVVWTGVEDSEPRKKLVREAFETTGAKPVRSETVTPALRCLANDESLAGVYVDVGRFRDYRAAQMAFSVRRALDPRRVVSGAEGSKVVRRPVAPEDRQEIFSSWNVGIVDLVRLLPASQREYEDGCLTLQRGENGGIAARLVRSRTQFGRRLHDAAAADVKLPELSKARFGDDRVALEVEWGHDLPAVLEDFALGSEQAEGAAFDRRGFFEDWSRVPGAVRMTGLATGAVHLAAHPHLLLRDVGGEFPATVVKDVVAGRAWVGGTRLEDELEDDAEDESEAKTGFVAAAVTLLVEPESRYLDALIRGLKQGVSGSGQTIEIDRRERESGRVELRLALNVPLKKAFGENRTEVEAVDVRIKPAALVGLAERVPNQSAPPYDLEQLASLGSIRVGQASDARTSVLAVQWGSEGRPEVSVPEVDFEPAPTPPSCVDALAVQFLEDFEELKGLRPMGGIETLRAMVADYDAATEACAERVPPRREELGFAAGRFRWILNQPFEQFMLSDWRSARDSCSEDRPKVPNSRQCRWYEQLDEDRFRRRLDFARQLYDEACERGDEQACQAKLELPELRE